MEKMLLLMLVVLAMLTIYGGIRIYQIETGQCAKAAQTAYEQCVFSDGWNCMAKRSISHGRCKRAKP